MSRKTTVLSNEALLKRAKGIAKRCAIGARNLDPKAAALALHGPHVCDAERFARRVSAPTETGCLLWLGTPNRLSGQGYFASSDGPGRPRTMTVQRFAYERQYGKQRSDLVLHRLCGNILCVNTDHMRLLTRRDLNAALRARRQEQRALADLLATYQGEQGAAWVETLRARLGQTD